MPDTVFEIVPYAGWERCARLSDGRLELVATLDVGPRIIKFAIVGDRNVLKEYDDQVGKTGGDTYRSYGGHRLWHAPEVKPRTYVPDNAPVDHAWDGRTLTLTPPPEGPTGIGKQLAVTLEGGVVAIEHRLTNHGPWAVELAPWAITVMAAGGRGILPQEPFVPHPHQLLPARPLVLWSYTDMADPRWTWGPRVLQLRQDPQASGPQKAGALVSRGWAAYVLDDRVFVKRFPFEAGAIYPDFGCNAELFTNAKMLEVESLGPLVRLEPGDSVRHVERWTLDRAQVGEDDAAVAAAIEPLLTR